MYQPLKISALFLCLGMLSCNKDNEGPEGTDGAIKNFSLLQGGPLTDVYHCGVAANGGGYLLGGGSSSTTGDFTGGSGPHDALVVRYDAAGKILWYKKFAGNNDEQVYHILPTNDGGYLLTGYSNSTNGDFGGNKGKMDVWVMKIDVQGNKTWSKTYGGSDNDYAHHAQPTADGGFLITGSSYSNDGDATGNHQAGKSDGIVIKINSTGTLQWHTMLGGTDNDFLFQAIPAAGGHFWLGGDTKSQDGDITTHQGAVDGWLVKLGADGALLQSHTYGGLSQDFFRSLAATADGGVILAGRIHSTNGPGTGNKGEADAWLLKANNGGNMVWSKLYGEKGHDAFTRITATPDGHFAASGATEVPNRQLDALLLSVDATGSQRWMQKPGGQFDDSGYDLFYASKEKKFVMAGASRSNDGDVKGNRGEADAWIYCFD